MISPYFSIETTHAQDKVQSLATTSGMTGLTIKRCKTKTMRINSVKEDPIKLGNEDIKDVTPFTYLGSVIAIDGGSERDVLVRISKARTAVLLLRPVWRSKDIFLRSKFRIFNTNVKTVLMYGAETWRVTKNIADKVQAFVNRCLRYMLGVRWPETISNENLWRKAQEERMLSQIRRKKWKWIGHTLRKQRESVTRQAFFWNPQGKRKRGRPKKQREKVSQTRTAAGRTKMERIRTTCSRPQRVEEHCRCLILHSGARRIGTASFSKTFEGTGQVASSRYVPKEL